jgi:hypothetical protein
VVRTLAGESMAGQAATVVLCSALLTGGGRTAAPDLTAFFGRLYNAALRPAEAAALRSASCHLPETGWGAGVAFAVTSGPAVNRLHRESILSCGFTLGPWAYRIDSRRSRSGGRFVSGSCGRSFVLMAGPTARPARR